MKLTKEQIELYEMDAEGKAYLEYNEKIGGEPISLMVPTGYPKGVEELNYKEHLRILMA